LRASRAASVERTSAGITIKSRRGKPPGHAVLACWLHLV
jgi:hypothetical protein